MVNTPTSLSSKSVIAGGHQNISSDTDTKTTQAQIPPKLFIEDPPNFPLTIDEADKLRTSQNFENLQARHLGVGNADTSPEEFINNLHRDSLASYVGHPPMLQYLALAYGEPKEIMRMRLLNRMVTLSRDREREKQRAQANKENGEGKVNGAEKDK